MFSLTARSGADTGARSAAEPDRTAHEDPDALGNIGKRIMERRIRSSTRLSPKPIVRAVALILGLLMLLASVGCASVFRAFPNLHEIKLIGLTAKGS